MKNISQSQINLYRSCPYAYALRYLYKKEQIMWDPSIMEVGRRVHDAIDNYYKYCFSPAFTEEEIRDEVYKILRAEWDVTLPPEFLKKAYTCVCNFSKFEFNNIKKGRISKPLTEVRIYNDGLMGIIDYLDLEKPTIIDFKTNTKAGLGQSSRLQAVMYKILVKGKFGLDIPYLTLQFLFPGESRVVKFDKKTLSTKEDIYKYKDKILNSWKTMNFPKEPRTPKACNWCGYKYYCEGA